MSRRYRVISDWQTSDRYIFNTDDGQVVLLRQYADIKDRQDGHVYDRGAFRVKATNLDTGKAHTRARTFYGESAWSNSQRIYDDVVFAQRFAR